MDDNDKHLTGDGINVSAYDNNGSATTFTENGATRTATYTRDNRIATLTTSSGTDTNTYNGDGLRVRKVSGGVTTNFLYDGSTLVAEYPGTASTYHASGVSFTDGATGNRFFYRENALGSNLAVVASTGNPASRTEYDGYGLEIPILAGTNTSHRFAGKHGYYKDDSSGLSLLGQRFYSPKIGKFLTQDPIGHSGGLNLYAYCDNSPLVSVDPDGTRPLNDSDISSLHTLRDKMHAAGITAAYQNLVTNHIKSFISSIPMDKKDPVGLAALYWAIGEVGNKGWGYHASPKSNKCNAFVYAAYKSGEGVHLPDRNPWMPGVQRFGADHFADIQNVFDGYTVFATWQAQPGDIMSFRKPEGQRYGHMTIVVGRGLLVYASNDYAKLGMYSTNKQMSRRHGLLRRRDD